MEKWGTVMNFAGPQRATNPKRKSFVRDQKQLWSVDAAMLVLNSVRQPQGFRDGFSEGAA